MHEMQTILTDVRSVSLSVSPSVRPSVRLSVTWLKSAAARALYTTCSVCGVIWCSLCQIILTTCLKSSNEHSDIQSLGECFCFLNLKILNICGEVDR